MIVSASRRTDIPAFHARWLLDGLRAGHCRVAHPWRPTQVSRVPLVPEAVDLIVFWTKNPTPLLPHLDEIDRLGFRYGFLFTVNDYAAAWEPGVPPLPDRIAAFRQLAARLGPDKVVWRYDPIILSRRMDAAFHRRAFGAIATALRGSTQRAIISVLDRYDRIEARLAAAESAADDQVEGTPLGHAEFPALIRALAELATANGMEIQRCAEGGAEWNGLGVPAGGCIDAGWIRRVFGLVVSARKDPGQRKDCLCAVARDIGVPDSCPHRCVYCYATGSGPTRVLGA